MKKKTFLTFLFIFLSSEAFCTNIRVVDFQKIIENNENLNILYEKIETDQEQHKIKFEVEELNLSNELKRIEKLNLILEASEIEKEIENYNNQLKIFNESIEKFNLHYENQVNNLKNQLINYLLEILKKYSFDNEIDLILDSNNYILSNNSINITDKMTDELNKKKIEISFAKY